MHNTWLVKIYLVGKPPLVDTAQALKFNKITKSLEIILNEISLTKHNKFQEYMLNDKEIENIVQRTIPVTYKFK